MKKWYQVNVGSALLGGLLTGVAGYFTFGSAAAVIGGLVGVVAIVAYRLIASRS